MENKRKYHASLYTLIYIINLGAYVYLLVLAKQFANIKA